MRGWLILTAVALLFGLAALIVVDDPAQDDLWLPPTVPPVTHETDPGAAPTAAPSPIDLASLDRRPSRHTRSADADDGATPEPARAAAAPATASVAPPSARVADPTSNRLEELLVAIRRALRTEESAPEELVQHLNALLRASPEAAREAIDRLFSAPGRLGRARAVLFEALLATKDDAVLAEMSRHIKESQEAWLSTTPRTRQELHAALLFGDPELRTRALRALARKHLSDPLVQDFLRTTAGDPTAPKALRDQAIRALGRTHTRASSAFLLGLLGSATEKRERAVILRALERHARFDPAVRETLLPVVYDANRPIAERRFAVTGLVRTEPAPAVRDALLHVLRTDDDVHLRRIAARGLRAYAEEPGVRALVNDYLRREKDAEVASTLRRFLAPAID